MYQLYYSPATCSLATHVLLNELDLEFKLLNKSNIPNFVSINPALTVPVLAYGDDFIKEGAAIALFLMEKYSSPLLPKEPKDRSNAISWMMFANASVHPAYGKMFFLSKNLIDNKVREEALLAAGKNVDSLWEIVENQLSKTSFTTGASLSMADIMLSVYANWNNFFPGLITLGPNTLRMVKEVSSRPSFLKAITAEEIKFSV